MRTLNPEQMTGLHLFYHPLSNCAGRVLLAIEEKGLKVEKHLIDLLKSKQLTDEYIAINPKGEVPAIVHDGMAMHESVTILRYLEETFPEVSLSPKEDSLREQMNDWLDAAGRSHEPGVVNYVYAKGYGRLPTPRDWAFYQAHIPHRTRFHEERRKGLVGCDIKQAEAVLHDQFSKLELALEGREYLVGNTYSLADIAWFPNAFVLQVLGYSLQPFPNVKRWMKRIESRPAFKHGYRKELPPVPMSLLGIIARVVTKIVRKTGDRL
ncbi:glutathione S-transferase family protein [Photobacterium sp. OFAV2-7]|uniref:glutathione S-transferase family protein n=1 Tax=Photobacterium sp. OFAV2-7 TaxID=2917748 RepID=UPI001EF61E8D|nr:glutathione S-transferase family protein [Photobacterium sp. OFAV2-7]MCG7588432.1 glutathione S-transferase family protein [Photobacterium sp. OFAV2-7]